MKNQAQPRILVIDDDSNLRDLLALVLGAKGYDVATARKGREASKLIELEPADLVIVDGVLPDTNGLDWIESFRNDDEQTPVIFLSAFFRNDFKVYQRLTKDLGVDRVMAKPIAPEKFANTVAQVLDERRARRLATAGADRLFKKEAGGTAAVGTARRHRATVDEAPVNSSPAATASKKSPPELAARLEALRARYVEKIPARIAEIQSAVRAARTTPDALQDAIDATHKLHGTAGTYGLNGVGEVAGALEQALEDVRTATRESSASVWQAVNILLCELASTARSKRAEQTSITRPSAAPEPMARILLVDRDQDFVDFVTEHVGGRAIDVIAARSSAEALEKARFVSLDAALLDRDSASPRLPTQLRALPRQQRLPFAYLSRSSSFADHVRCAHSGSALVLSKPIEGSALVAALDELLARNEDERPKILVVDDDEDFHASIEHFLDSEGMAASCLKDPDKVLDALDWFQPDLVVLDMNMPGFNGLDVCRYIRTQPRWHELPIVFATASDDDRGRIAAFRAGGDDYIRKPIVREELVARIRVRVERARLLRERADRDPLSGLLLRRAFSEAVARDLSYGRRHGRPLAIALLDIDHFKQVNDLHGHAAGDRVLARFGKLLRQRFRNEDIRGRWGGEEFILAFPGETPESIRGAVERLLMELRSITFEGRGGSPLQVGFTAGVAGFPDDADTLEDLVEVADRRLYHGKKLGRSRVVVATAGDDVRSSAASTHSNDSNERGA